MKEPAARMKDLDGYPVRSTFTIDGASGAPAASEQEPAAHTAEARTEKSAGEKVSPGAAGGHVFQVVTEVTSISTSPAPAGSFEVPAGCKLQMRD